MRCPLLKIISLEFRVERKECVVRCTAPPVFCVALAAKEMLSSKSIAIHTNLFFSLILMRCLSQSTNRILLICVSNNNNNSSNKSTVVMRPDNEPQINVDSNQYMYPYDCNHFSVAANQFIEINRLQSGLSAFFYMLVSFCSPFSSCFVSFILLFTHKSNQRKQKKSK